MLRHLKVFDKKLSANMDFLFEFRSVIVIWGMVIFLMASPRLRAGIERRGGDGTDHCFFFCGEGHPSTELSLPSALAGI